MRFVDHYLRRSEDPAGVEIVANARGLDLIVNGQVVTGVSLVQEPLLVRPEAIVTRWLPQRVDERVTVEDAKRFLRTTTLKTNDGDVNIGEELLAAFTEHEVRFMAARSAASGLMVPLPRITLEA